LFGTNYVPIPQLPAGGANACLRADQREGSLFGNRVDDAVTGTFDAIAAAIGDAAFTLVREDCGSDDCTDDGEGARSAWQELVSALEDIGYQPVDNPDA
jgi:hypothetical protein